MKKIIAIAAAALLCISALAQNNKEWNASYFGIKSNGLIDNTTSIQKAIDFIAEKGGGTLTFCVGRYLTGAVYLRSGVNIRLDAAADIIGTDNIYGYKGQKAIFNGIGVENVRIFATRGNGVVEGYLPEGTPVPTLFYFENCKNIKLVKVLYRNSAVPGKFYEAVNSEVVNDACFTDTRE